MRPVSAREILESIAEASGHPLAEVTTAELVNEVRLVAGRVQAIGEQGDLARATRHLLEGVLEVWPDEAAPQVAMKSATALLARNFGRLTIDERVFISLLRDGVRGRRSLPEVLDQFQAAIACEKPPLSKRRAKQSQRLFGPRGLAPIEVVMGLVHPIALLPRRIRSKSIDDLRTGVAAALREAEIELSGVLSFRLTPTKAEAVGANTPHEAERWQLSSASMLGEVDGLVSVDLAGVCISEGATHQRMLHQAIGGPSVWIQDPNCRSRGRLSSMWAREAGCDILHAEPHKIRQVLRKWLVRNAARLEWVARTRSEVALELEPLRHRLRERWQAADASEKAAVTWFTGMGRAALERCLEDVHYLAAVPGLRLRRLESWVRPASRQPPASEPRYPISESALIQAQEIYGWGPEVAPELYRYARTESRSAHGQEKRQLRQPQDWEELRIELGL